MSPIINKPWDKNIQLLLVWIIAFNIAPHTFEIPLWLTLTSFVWLSYKLLHLMRGTPLPNTWLLSGAALLGAGGVWFEYRTLAGQEAASALLVYLASLKLLETNRYRDAMLVVFTSYFLLMAHLLNSQSSLPSTLYMGLDVLLITTLMYSLQSHMRDRRSIPSSFRPVMRMLTYAIPVWIFLFLVFPRFSTSLWRLESNNPSTGFSENLDPGAISRLIDSEEIAFRVSFLDKVAPAQLYWRGGILTRSEGLQWRPPPTKSSLKIDETSTASTDDIDAINYEVFLEPSFRKWLFALDYPVSLKSPQETRGNSIRRLPGFIFQTEREVVSRMSYRAVSTYKSPSLELTPEDRSLYLQVPADLDPRITRLTQTLQSEVAKDPLPEQSLAIQINRKLLQWLVKQDFRYTRSPGALNEKNGVSQLAEFLFSSKKGFCEHFAAAHATLMRLMNIPSRVVIGFQGGKFNDFGGYILVRNLDAHSWTEIWVDDPKVKGRGYWHRVDPASVLAPLRIELGGDYNLLNESDLQMGLSTEQIQRRLHASLNGLPLRLSLLWDAAQMRWNSFLLGYNLDLQKDLLDRLGIQGAPFFIIAVLIFGAMVGVVVFVLILSLRLRARSRKEDPLLKEWDHFCAVLAHQGSPRLPNEGPLDFAKRASLDHPHLADEIQAIARIFAVLRYSSSTHPSQQVQELRSFRQSIQRFSRLVSKADSSRSVVS